MASSLNVFAAIRRASQNFAHMVRMFLHGGPTKTRQSVRRSIMNILSHVSPDANFCVALAHQSCVRLACARHIPWHDRPPVLFKVTSHPTKHRMRKKKYSQAWSSRRYTTLRHADFFLRLTRHSPIEPNGKSHKVKTPFFLRNYVSLLDLIFLNILGNWINFWARYFNFTF